MGFTVHTFDDDELGPVARFLRDFSDSDEDEAFGQRSDDSAVLDNLKNRFASNPARSADVPLGFHLKDDAGKITGTLLVYPWRFRQQNQILVGLGVGAWFVDPAARPHGLLLFRRFLDLKAADFYYANTCNASSAGLWMKSKGVPVKSSGYEFLYPIDIAPLAQEFAVRKRLALPASLFSAGTGKLLNPYTLVRSATAKLKVQQTRDWEKVAAIAETNRDPDSLICDRSVAYLAWSYSKYEEENAERKVFVFETTAGKLGWFSMGWRRRGKFKQVYGARLLDWSIPNGFDFAEIVDAALKIARSRRSHLFTIQGRADLPIRLRGAIKRYYEVPRAYVRSTSHDPNGLAESLIIAGADVF